MVQDRRCQNDQGDVNTDKWRIESPPGISKQECNDDKLETRITKLEEQTRWMYDRMTATAAETSTWNRHSMKIRRQWRRMAKVGRKLVDQGQSR